MGGCGCGCVEILYYYNGGGSGGGFIGTVKLTRGTYTVHVGAGQYLKRQVTGSAPIYKYYSIADSSYIQGIVSCGGASLGTQGGNPVLSTTALTTTLNRAGNAGGNNGTACGDVTQPVTTGMIIGASVYNGYGKGSGDSPYNQQSAPRATQAGNGYIKVVYKGRR